MKAWVLTTFNTPYQLQQLPLPPLTSPHDLLIRVTACSYCHTDAVVAAGTVTPPSLPHIGCHEYTGTIAAFPSGLTSSHGYTLGDRVAVRGCGNHVCGTCRECTTPSAPLADEPGFSVFCPRAGAGLGVDRDGGFREFAVVDARQVAAVPEGLGAVQVAPLMCAGLTMYAALVKSGLRAGERVGIMGCGGGLGHLGLQFAVKMGLRTTGVDVKERALELARGLGTGAEVVDGRGETARGVKERMGREDGWTLPSEMGVDAVLILPESQQAFDYAMELVRDGGKVILLSFPPDGFRVAATDIVFRRISLEGSLIGSNKAMRDMFAFCVEHGVRAKTTQFAFEELNDLVEAYHAGTPGKLVIDMKLE
ncbi:alcohol dehydrogenase [Polyplosphaeria fusca]|uniref:Alcohol dehydrogenase n=1 Tax=Polyplosphaeria fusca TaxID=682080 RepID=A0A9P4V350_9PLEO|nr:alcohol dehydrogenase [Polyplosphaeria fusca]